LVPIVMLMVNVKFGFGAVLGLILFFIAYRISDNIFNKKGKPAPLPEGAANGTILKGLKFLVAGIVVILVAGRYLSISAGSLILLFDIPAWAVGWILGFITSISELTSFVEIYNIHKPNNRSGYFKDTQEAIDALVTSNVSNLGIILPLGIISYIIVT
jgi:Ca2+/Na+ antiporter